VDAGRLGRHDGTKTLPPDGRYLVLEDAILELRGLQETVQHLADGLFVAPLHVIEILMD
jgi:hypothetical protein